MTTDAESNKTYLIIGIATRRPQTKLPECRYLAETENSIVRDSWTFLCTENTKIRCQTPPRCDAVSHHLIITMFRQGAWNGHGGRVTRQTGSYIPRTPHLSPFLSHSTQTPTPFLLFTAPLPTDSTLPQRLPLACFRFSHTIPLPSPPPTKPTNPSPVLSCAIHPANQTINRRTHLIKSIQFLSHTQFDLSIPLNLLSLDVSPQAVGSLLWGFQQNENRDGSFCSVVSRFFCKRSMCTSWCCWFLASHQGATPRHQQPHKLHVWN